MERIPSKDRKEWQELLTGQLDVEFTNYILQMKVTQAKKDITNEVITIEKAVDEIHALCGKYVLAVKLDMEIIFKD